MKLQESEFKELFDKIKLTTLESNKFPINYNLLSGEQEEFFKEVVYTSLEKYYDSYIELLAQFKEELGTLSEQVQEVINEFSK